MTKSLSNSLTLLLATIGCVLALLLTVESIAPNKLTLPCSASHNGCEGTLNSAYSHLGKIPTATFGLGMYVIFVGLCLKRRKLIAQDRLAEEAWRAAGDAKDENGEPSASADQFMQPRQSSQPPSPLRQAVHQLEMFTWALALAGFSISWWLQYTSLFELQSFCPYCFSSAVLVSLIFLLASRDYWLDGRPMNGEQKVLCSVISGIFVLLGLVYGPMIMTIIHGHPTGPMSEETKLRDILISKDMNTLGPANAKFTIVEFADYMCPHCAEASKAIPDLLQKRSDVRFVFRNYPLGFPHVKFKYSADAAYLAEAAALQGKFWEMHDVLFEKQDEIKADSFNPAQFGTYAQMVRGLDVKKLRTDSSSQAVMDRVSNDHAIGDRARMQMTPTFFVVSPSKVTSFIGKDELEKAMSDPKSPVWQ